MTLQRTSRTALTDLSLKSIADFAESTLFTKRLSKLEVYKNGTNKAGLLSEDIKIL